MTLTRTNISMVRDGWLRPEQFGPIGISAAKDTAAWKKLVAAANAQGGAVKIDLSGPQYLLNGTGVYDDDQTFKNIDSIWVRIDEETEIRQKVALTHTFKFKNCLDVRITGGRLIGFAQTQIDAGQPLTETDLNSSSASNISGMLFYDCKNVEIVRLKTQNVFGRDILALGCELLRVRECKLIGVGWTYNDPIRDGHQGNGEDAAIYAIPTDFTLSGTAWKQVVEVYNCHIEGHSFAIRTILNKRLKVHGNYFGPTPGQYHIYGTDDDGVSMIGNHFYRSRIVAVKLQHENLAGTIYGPLWVTGKAYVVGDVVRNSLILWECVTAHTSGGVFDSSRWKQHSRFIRRGAVFASNIVENCGGGLAYIAPFIVEVNGRNIWSEGAQFIGNSFVNCTSDIIRLERCINVKVTGNKVDGGTYGVLGRYVSGDISNNDFREIGQNAISLSLAWTTNISENKFWDCGHAGANDAERAAVVIGTLTGTDPPLFGPNPRVFFRNNGFMYTGGVGSKYLAMPSDCPGAYLVMDVDTRNVWEIEGTFGTPTTKKFRIDGSVVHQFRNHFASNGFANTAQNEPDFTLTGNSSDFALNPTTDTTTGVGNVLATLIDALTAKRIVA